MTFCPNCTCRSCTVEITKRKNTVLRKSDAEERMIAKKAREREKHMGIAELRNRESAMIWLLINTARSQEDAVVVSNIVTAAMNVKFAHVNHKRRQYATLINDRVQLFDKLGVEEPFMARLRKVRAIGGIQLMIDWTKPPGTSGAELPPQCDHGEDPRMCRVCRMPARRGRR